MHRVVRATALEDFRLDLVFEDGTRGTVDLSHLAGRGIFRLWNDYAEFRKVTVGETGELAWGDNVDPPQQRDINGRHYDCDPPIDLDGADMYIIFRGYMEPATKVGPDDNELLWDRGIYFTGKVEAE